jgi:hypothetical protein
VALFLVVLIEPQINLCCITNNGSIKPTVDSEDRGGVLIRSIWKKGTDFIFDVRVTYTDATSYRKKDPQKVLHLAERLKKNTYLQYCLDQRYHFTHFFV